MKWARNGKNPRVGCPTKLGKLGKRLLVGPVTKELVATDGLSS